MSRSGCTAVVLAGGESRRFGSDKLAAAVDGESLLERALEGLADDVTVVVVGPYRELSRAVRFVREEPPGGGPAAAMVTGLREALRADPDTILVLPGDAPYAGHAASELRQVLPGTTGGAVVGTDATGFDQPLQLALTRQAAEALVRAAGVGQARGGSARALVNRLDPPPLRWRLSTQGHWDVDTPDQLLAWQARSSPAVRAILTAVDALPPVDRPVVVALDGRSGSGKSTLAAALTLSRPATVVHTDDFYSPALAALEPSARDRLPAAGVAERVLDWRRLRTEALEPLAAGRSARFAPYDWETGEERVGRPVELPPQPLVIVEGVYSARPELADLVDLAVHVHVDPDVRRRRLAGRLHDLPALVGFWESGEDHYFADVRPVGSYDLSVSTVGPA